MIILPFYVFNKHSSPKRNDTFPTPLIIWYDAIMNKSSADTLCWPVIVLISKVPNPFSSVYLILIFSPNSERQIISWPLGFMIGWESNHTLNQIFQFHCYCTVFARVSCSFDFFPLDYTYCANCLHYLQNLSTLRAFAVSLRFPATLLMSQSFFQNSLKYKETGGYLHSYYYMTQWLSHLLESL